MIITCPQCAAEYHVNADLFGVSARPVQCTACGRQWLQPPAARAVSLPAAAPAQPAAIAVEPPLSAGSEPAAADRAAAADSAPDETVAAARSGDADRESESAAASDDATTPVDETGDADAAGAPAAPLPEAPAATAARRPWLVMAMAALATLLACIALLLVLQRPIMSVIPQSAALYRMFGLAPAPVGSGLSLRDVTSLREWTGSEDILIVSGTVVNVASDRRPVPMLRIALVDLDDNELHDVMVPPQRETLAPGERTRFEARIAAPMAEARRMVVSFAAAPSPH
jgi:predicted Zn finger-like uncharacterized protein